ncbi:MAG: Coenzyme F420 hydrogenase/dehydrogenase, beta subunit C-terminal domain [Muribaculaceae bacterium]|nr:Coenzyme F420 hydrogenase/dehydrogenase, beta subunit C-terminal domain [Muribaculaceae bacterium]
MIIIDDLNNCTGCGLCNNICPHTAISMIQDEKGFKYPHINIDKCTDCGACRKICPQNSFNPLTSKNIYAAFSKDKDVRMTSSSGGIFTELCKYVIGNGGIVFGVKYDKDWLPVFGYAESLEECEAFKVSKYAEADLTKVYHVLYEKIKSGTLVLFSGTPCQAAAIRTRFSNIKNLIIIDLICNSVPSAKLLNDYLREIKKEIGDIKDFNMRFKRPSWENSSYKIDTNSVSITGENKTKFSKINRLVLSYRDLFFSHLSTRISCQNCKYRGFNRAGDISIGDFWGINSICPEMNDGKGTSIILINSEKGKDIWNLIDTEKRSVESTSVIRNKCIPLKNLSINKNYNQFWKDYVKYGYLYVAKKYTIYGNRLFFRHKIGNILRKITHLFNNK